MSAVSFLVRTGWSIVAACAAAGCGGERVALGDGPIDVTEPVDGRPEPTSVVTSNGGAPVVGDDDSAPVGDDDGPQTDDDDTPADDNVPADDDILPPSDDDPPDAGSGENVPSGDDDLSDAGDDVTLEPDPDASVDAGPMCERGQIAANEVLWIGDTWITFPGNQTQRVRDLARAAGSLGPDEDYRSAATAAVSLNQIIDQYRSAPAPPVRVLLMDGGTWETLNSSGSPDVIAGVIATFEQFLADLATEGVVEHVVYMLVPELPPIFGVAELRPGLMAACEASTVPCHFLDLQPLWAATADDQGRSEYTDSSGIQASELGANLIGEQIWSIMQENCIAQ